MYEIKADTIKAIKHLTINPELSEWYPLAVGNKWIYHNTVCNFDYPPTPCNSYNEVVEVIKDTVLSNGFTYFKIRSNSGDNFERYNYEDGTVRRYSADSSLTNNEFIIEDLMAEIGDTSCTNRFYYYECSVPKIFIEKGSEYLFNNVYLLKKFQVQGIEWYTYSLVKGFGIDSIASSFDFGSSIAQT